MRFSATENLWLCLLFFREASASGYLFSETLSSSDRKIEENLAVKFFSDLAMASFRTVQNRHITVIGASVGDFNIILPAFKDYPLIICTVIKEYTNPVEFSPANVVVIFLNRSSLKTFENDVEILARSALSSVIFIFTGKIQISEIWMIFHLCLRQQNVADIGLIQFQGKGRAEIWKYYGTKNCSMEVAVGTVWKPGIGFTRTDRRSLDLLNLSGCTVNVSSLTFSPNMEIREDLDGSLSVAGGMEGKLLLTLAEKLNFTLALRFPPDVDSANLSYKMSIVNHVASGTAEFGIGRLRPTNSLHKLVALSIGYDDECVAWGVPHVMAWRDDILRVEFSSVVWIWIGVVFILSCVIEYAHRNFDVLYQKQDVGVRRAGYPKSSKSSRFFSVFLDVCAFHLGNSVLRVPRTSGGRLILLIYLLYAMVITTGYRSSLASLLAIDMGAPLIDDAEGIIEHNLTVGGSFDDYETLKNQASESESSQVLVNRYVINNNDTETMDRLKHSRSYALLARRTYMNFETKKSLSDENSVTFDIVSDCVLAYRTIVVVSRKSFFLKPINYVIQSLVESGILKHWNIDEVHIENMVKLTRSETYPKERLTFKFRFIFRVYMISIAFCFAVFLIELLIPKLTSFMS